jgi:hypothetical protein
MERHPLGQVFGALSRLLCRATRRHGPRSAFGFPKPNSYQYQAPSFPDRDIGGYWVAGIFETITVKAMMHGNPVEGFDPGQLRKLVNETCCEKHFQSATGRAVRADELEFLAGRNNISYARPAHRDGLVAG